MAEARDRLVRPFDIAAAYVEWRSRSLRVYTDPPQAILEFIGTPARPRTPAGLEFGVTGVIGGRGIQRSSLRTPRTRNVSGRNSFGFSTPGRENTPAGSSHPRRGRGSNSVLPSWYPRRPLQDITAVMMAIERRSDRLAESDGEHTEGQVPLNQSVIGQSLTPYSAVRTKKCPPSSIGKVSKIIRDVANQTAEGEFLTPQKKLLNSIDTVEKVVREELDRLKRTPSAKKAEREKKVRTLMSMR